MVDKPLPCYVWAFGTKSEGRLILIEVNKSVLSKAVVSSGHPDIR